MILHRGMMPNQLHAVAIFMWTHVTRYQAFDPEKNDEMCRVSNPSDPSDPSMWVCLKIVYPYTQWFSWSLSLLNGYFIGNIPYFQTYPCGAHQSDLNWSPFSRAVPDRIARSNGSCSDGLQCWCEAPLFWVPLITRPNAKGRIPIFPLYINIYYICIFIPVFWELWIVDDFTSSKMDGCTVLGGSWGDLYGYNYTILTPKQIGIRPSNYADMYIYIYMQNQSKPSF